MNTLSPQDLSQKLSRCFHAFAEAITLADEVKSSFRLTLPHHHQSQLLLPHIELKGHTLFCNHVALDLSRKPQMIKLFKLFLEHSDQERDRDGITMSLHADVCWKSISERRRTNLHQNTIKLISRARELAEDAFYPHDLAWIEWFSYDITKAKWSLYRIRTDHLRKIEQQFAGGVN